MRMSKNDVIVLDHMTNGEVKDRSRIWYQEMKF
jgi:hypothetical protein